MTTHRRTPAITAAAIALLVVLTGCGGDDAPGNSGDEPAPTGTTQAPPSTGSPGTSPTGSPPSESQTPSPDPSHGAGVVIEATIRGGELTPNGERVKAKLGEPIIINVDADRPGELHVHSTPEQTLRYEEGNTTLELIIETPGVVEVEDHEADKLLVSLEVS